MVLHTCSCDNRSTNLLLTSILVQRQYKPLTLTLNLTADLKTFCNSGPNTIHVHHTHTQTLTPTPFVFNKVSLVDCSIHVNPKEKHVDPYRSRIQQKTLTKLISYGKVVSLFMDVTNVHPPMPSPSLQTTDQNRVTETCL